MENVRTSNLVSSQLPDFVRSDYPKFVTFLEKYYEWLETTDSVSYEINALRNANDIDDVAVNLIRTKLLNNCPE